MLKNKFLPEWVQSLSMRQARILLKSMSLGFDSCYTSSAKLADNVMQLVLHCGWSSNMKSNNNNWDMTIIKLKNAPEVKPEQNKVIENYNQPVFCLEVTWRSILC